MDIVVDQSQMGVFGYALIAIILLCLLLWLAALISIIRNEFVGANEKLMWAVLVVFLPFVGTILYYAIGVKRIKP